MKTFYDILKINSDASNEEIVNAYMKLEKEYQNDEENLKKIRVAKEILTNPEARSNYDNKIKEMQQNELISNISVNTQKYNIEEEEKKRLEEEKQDEIKKQQEAEILRQTEKLNRAIKNEKIVNRQPVSQKSIKDLNHVPEEKIVINNQNSNIGSIEDIKKAKKEEKKRLREAKKELKRKEARKKEMYEEAYASYLRGMGYKVKTKWTWKRIKKLFLTIVILIIIGVILWHIPSVKNKCIELYENYFIVKILADIIIGLVKAVFNGIKSLLKVGD